MQYAYNDQSCSQDQLLTPHQAGQLLVVTEQTLAIWRSTKRYSLKYVKVGRYVRYKLLDIRAFIEERTVGGDDHE